MLGPRRCGRREIPLDADGAGGGKVLALATQDETMHYPIDTDRRCVHVEASQLLRGRRALHGGAQRAHVLLELCHVRRQPDRRRSSMKATSFSSVSVVERASLASIPWGIPPLGW